MERQLSERLILHNPHKRKLVANYSFKQDLQTAVLHHSKTRIGKKGFFSSENVYEILSYWYMSSKTLEKQTFSKF